LGRVLAGRFRLDEQLAKGGMGRVYRAEQVHLGRQVAVKVMEVGETQEDLEEFRVRFFREASVCAKLTHPNTVRVIDYGEDEDAYFIAMELLEGTTLNQLIRGEGRLEPKRAIQLIRQVARALSQAHAMGVIHRDLKPSNIMICDHGEEFVKVLDFGLVKPVNAHTQVTQAGAILGSPAYMSPEQILGHEIVPATDVYALGVVLFAAVTGELPFPRKHPMAVLNAHINAEVPRFSEVANTLGLPDSLEWVIRTCLEKDPADRFQSVRDLEQALKRVQLEILGHGPAMPMRLHEGALVADDDLSGEQVQSTPTAPMLRPLITAEEPVPEPEPEPSATRQFVLAMAVTGGVGVLVLLMAAVGIFFGLRG
jgi:serine/threonine-protein kinase